MNDIPEHLKVFVAKIVMKPTSEGGRQGPTPSGCFRTVLKHKDGDFSCRLYYGKDEKLVPGKTHTVKVVLLYQEFYSKFAVGDKISIFDGKSIADGEVIEISEK